MVRARTCGRRLRHRQPARGIRTLAIVLGAADRLQPHCANSSLNCMRDHLLESFISRVRQPIAAICLAAAAAASANTTPDATSNEARLTAATHVLNGRIESRSLIEKCARKFAPGLDVRFFLSFWETKRFDIFEGARQVTRGESSQAPAASAPVIDERASATGNDEQSSLDSSLCVSLLKNTGGPSQEIANVSASEIELMRHVYSSSNPEAHIARDQSLHNDCMKASFNSGHRDFEGAERRCDCARDAMDSMPQGQVDEWFAKAHSGAADTMTTEPWWPAYSLKLVVCFALK